MHYLKNSTFNNIFSSKTMPGYCRTDRDCEKKHSVVNTKSNVLSVPSHLSKLAYLKSSLFLRPLQSTV